MYDVRDAKINITNHSFGAFMLVYETKINNVIETNIFVIIDTPR
jgi:hypothetical protein